MTLLLLMFVFILLVSVIEQLVPKSFFLPITFFCATCLICLVVLRPAESDRDHYNYISFFEAVGSPSEYFNSSLLYVLYEPTYYLIPAVLKKALPENDFVFFSFMLFGLLGVLLKLTAIHKLSKFFYASTLIYFVQFFFLHEMTQIRVGVASGILLCSIPNLYRGNWGKYFFTLFIACLFHYSSIVLLPLILLNTKSINQKIYLGILAATVLIAFLNLSDFVFAISTRFGFLGDKIESYKSLAEMGVDSFGKINKFNLLFLTQFGLSVFLLLNINAITRQNCYAPILIKIQVFGLLSFQLLTSIPALAFRISELLLVVQIVTIPFCIYTFKNRWFGFGIVAVYAFALLYLNLFYLQIFNSFEYFTI